MSAWIEGTAWALALTHISVSPLPVLPCSNHPACCFQWGKEPWLVLGNKGRHSHSDTNTGGDTLGAKQAVGHSWGEQKGSGMGIWDGNLASPRLCCSPVHGPDSPPVIISADFLLLLWLLPQGPDFRAKKGKKKTNYQSETSLKALLCQCQPLAQRGCRRIFSPWCDCWLFPHLAPL